MEDQDLDASIKIGKAKKLAKMKNVMAMMYMNQCLSSMAMLNVLYNIQAEAGWPTARAYQLFDNLKYK